MRRVLVCTRKCDGCGPVKGSVPSSRGRSNPSGIIFTGRSRSLAEMHILPTCPERIWVGCELLQRPRRDRHRSHPRHHSRPSWIPSLGRRCTVAQAGANHRPAALFSGDQSVRTALGYREGRHRQSNARNGHEAPRRHEGNLTKVLGVSRQRPSPHWSLVVAGSTHLPCSLIKSLSCSTASSCGMLNFTGFLPT